jgi:CubicO group peptidase (beta-lactamase class C family)
MLGRFISLTILSAVVTVSVGCAADSLEEDEGEVAAGELNSALDDPARGVHTDALLIMRDGRVLSESYGRGYDANTKHLSWSMAKSIAGILVAQEIDRGSGTMSLTSPIQTYVPEVQSPARVVDVLQMSSGIGFNEEYSGVPVTSDATRMLYMKGPQTGFLPFLATLPQRTDARPGDHFYYSSGDTNLLMAALRNVAPSQQAYDAMPFERFFKPLGISNATFEQDSKGIFVGSSYVYLTARDFGKIGSLLVERGKRGTETIIPGWYFDLMSRVAPGVSSKALAGTSQTRAYSSQITTNLPIPARGLPSEYADLPTDSLLMIGHQGQLVIASPSQKLVIVRLAMDKGASFDRKQFLAKVVRLVEAKSGPLSTARKENPAQYTNAPPAPPPDADADADAERAKIADYLKVPHLIRALAAKEFCSCIKVVGRTERDCKDDLRASLPILPTLRVNDTEGSVSAVLGTGVFGKKSVAVYRGPELGCTLTESE